MNCIDAMKPYAQEAEVLRLLLNYGFISGNDIITWTDQTIMSETEIDQNLIEVSTMPPDKTSDISSKLSEIAVGADSFEALRTAFGRMYDTATKMNDDELERLAVGLSQIPHHHNYNLPDDLNFLNATDDMFSMAKSGLYGDVPTVRKEFLEDLNRFKNRSAI
jgi:hypothetical protein